MALPVTGLARGAQPVSERLLRLRLASRHEAAEGIAAFDLVDCNGDELPAFIAGSHIDVYLPGEMTRQYSLRNDPAERHRYRLGVLREVAGRGGSAYMHEKLKPGDTIQASMPRNAFALREDAPFSLLLAGGIGITPILSMAYRLAYLGRDFVLHYAARTADRMAFRDEIEASAFTDKVHLHFDDGADGQKLDLATLLGQRPPGAHLYACGPGGFLDAVIAKAETAWPSDAVHREYFANAAPMLKAGDKPFRIKLASDGRSFEVEPGRSIVDVLSENGIEIPVSCEQGICGTCVTGVVEGKPDHRDLVLTERQRADRMTLCCSRSFTEELVLKL